LRASQRPLVINSIEGKNTDMNEATIKITGVERRLLTVQTFDYFTEPQMARSIPSAKGSVADSPLTLRLRGN
jgi:hypothetical protein